MNRKRRIKLKQFAKAYVKHKLNGTKAVLSVYDMKQTSAGTEANRLLKNPIVQEDIKYYLARANYDPSNSITSLISNEEAGRGVKATASDSIRASELLLKLSGKLIDRKQTSNISIDLTNLDKSKLLELRNKYNKLIDK